jgi:hypothetical protein
MDSSKMWKEFEHEGRRFVIEVSLNVKVERRIDGKRYHDIRVVAVDQEGPFAAKASELDLKEVDSKNLSYCVNRIEKDLRYMVEGRLHNGGRELTHEQEELVDLGFNFSA